MIKKIFMGMCCIMVAFTFTGCIPNIEQTTGDYILNISVSATTFNEGEEIEVTMAFENNSGEEQQIVHARPMINILTIEDGEYTQLSVADFSILAKDETVTTSYFGSNLKKGKYHLIAIADFSLGWGISPEEVRVFSNTIIITVK